MTEEPHYYVYVIELDDAVGERIDPRRPCVYVGQCIHLPEVRFQQHRQGYRASRHVQRYGKYLRPRLYKKYNPLPSREMAEHVEEELAAKLRRDGFTVFGGH